MGATTVAYRDAKPAFGPKTVRPKPIPTARPTLPASASRRPAADIRFAGFLAITEIRSSAPAIDNPTIAMAAYGQRNSAAGPIDIEMVFRLSAIASSSFHGRKRGVSRFKWTK